MGIISETICSEWHRLSGRAQEQARKTRPDCFTRWALCEGDNWYTEITASSLDEAMDEARDGVDRGNYDGCDGTLYIDVRARNVVTGEEDCDTVVLEPEEPDCCADAHDWQSPFEVLGGIRENPGVWGNGGGVIIRECCANCGAYRETNTWAQRRDTGEQGLTEVSYEEADEASMAWVLPRRAGRLLDAAEALLDSQQLNWRRRDSSIIVTVEAIGSATSQIEGLRNLLGDAYSVEWTGDGNTDADGDSTDDIMVTVA